MKKYIATHLNVNYKSFHSIKCNFNYIFLSFYFILDRKLQNINSIVRIQNNKLKYCTHY